MSHHKIEFDQECKACHATGLYVGFAERDGYAVVCSQCKGSGEQHTVIEYDDFEGRKSRDGIARVLEVNPGICVGRLEGADFGGIPYEEWDSGGTFPAGTEMREFTCPAWWYQSADYARKPKWKECGLGTFSSCSRFAQKDRCWTRFDAEELEGKEG